MVDSEAARVSANVRAIRPDVEIEAKAPKAPKAKRARKPKETTTEDRALPEFGSPAEALAQVVKTTASVQRAESKASELGKAIGQETKKRREALVAAVDGIEGNSEAAVELREAFGKITSAEETRKSAGSRIKKYREAIAELLENLPKDAHESVKRVRASYMRLEKHKSESSEARAEAKAKVTAARAKRDAAVDGARQLDLAL